MVGERNEYLKIIKKKKTHNGAYLTVIVHFHGLYVPYYPNDNIWWTWQFYPFINVTGLKFKK